MYKPSLWLWPKTGSTPRGCQGGQPGKEACCRLVKEKRSKWKDQEAHVEQGCSVERVEALIRHKLVTELSGSKSYWRAKRGWWIKGEQVTGSGHASQHQL